MEGQGEAATCASAQANQLQGNEVVVGVGDEEGNRKLVGQPGSNAPHSPTYCTSNQKGGFFLSSCPTTSMHDKTQEWLN